jgi:predicted porin
MEAMPVTHLNPSPRAESLGVGKRRGALVLAAALLGFAGVTQAQTSAPPPPPENQSLTMFGVTIYGIVDIGLQYDSHGAPFSDYFPAGSADIVQKNSNHSEVGATPSNLSQSRVGLSGLEPLGVGDWNGIFKLETFFNPQSGEISDALKSLAQNNGRSVGTQTTNLDSSIAGQAFQQSFVGFSSPTFGSITFGRQNTLIADGVSKYDPQRASQAFSLIGLSGTTAGGGDTQDRRLDQSLKYIANYSGFHVGAEYKFNGSTGAASTAFEGQLGFEMKDVFQIDAYYAQVNDAIAAAAISAADFATLPLGFAPDKSLAATVSDNTTFGVMATYSLGAPKFFAGYEHIKFANPGDPLAPGFDDIGGYKLAFINNAAYDINKKLQVYWAGIRWQIQKLELIGAYYGYHQNSYATGSHLGCTDASNGSCSGTENVVSFSADYHFTKRFDMFIGAMYSSVSDGLANGYLNTNNIDPTLGVRFQF